MEHCPICNNSIHAIEYVKHIHGCYFQDCISKGYLSNCTCTSCLRSKSSVDGSDESRKKIVKLNQDQYPNDQNLFNKMPSPVLQTIFSYFNKYDHFVVSLVCKQWNSLIVRDQSTDCQDIFLHFCETGSLSVLKWLRFQTSLYRTINLFNWDLMKAAVSGNHFEVVRWLKENGVKYNHDEESLLSFAVQTGNVELCKWLKINRAELRKGDDLIYINLPILQLFTGWGYKPGKKFYSYAAEKGQLELLKWVKSRGYHWNASACSGAAKAGRLDILKWARKLDCPWDVKCCKGAASGGHLDILQWARQQGCPWNEETIEAAGKNGHFEVLKWAVQNGCPIRKFINFSVEMKNIQILEYLLSKNSLIGADACVAAIDNGQMETLKWLVNNGVIKSQEICCAAARRGDIEILKWLHENGFQWTESTITNAVKHPQVFKWLRNNGCPWNSDVYCRIVDNSDIKLLKWVLKRHIPTRCLCDAAVTGNIEVVKVVQQFLYQPKQLEDLEDLVCIAALNGKIRLLSWLLKNGYSLISDIREDAAEYEDLLEWLDLHLSK